MNLLAPIAFALVVVLFIAGVFALGGAFDGGGDPTLTVPFGTIIRVLFLTVAVALAPIAIFFAVKRGG